MKKRNYSNSLLLSELMLLGDEIEESRGLFRIINRFSFAFMFNNPYLVRVQLLSSTEIMFAVFNREKKLVEYLNGLENLKEWIGSIKSEAKNPY